MKKQTQIGFTLIEILIALFIFTIVAMIATNTLHTVIQAESGTEEKANRLREIQTALLIISRDVEQSVNRPITNDIGKEEVAFKGTPREFSFTHLGLENPLATIAMSSLERSGYYWQKNTLWRQVWPVLDLPPKTRSHVRPILTHVSEAQFSYLDGNGKFHQQWPLASDTNRPLPKAIRIELNLADWGKLTQTIVIFASPNQGPAIPSEERANQQPHAEDEQQPDHEQEEEQEKKQPTQTDEANDE